MNGHPSRILFFGEQKYTFIKASVEKGRVHRVEEPSELMEAVKREDYPVLIFDHNHPRFSRSLVARIYRRSPLSEFWHISRADHIDYPIYMADAVFPENITRQEFENKLSGVLKIKELLLHYKMVGKSSNLKQVAETISQVAPTDISTLIIGPSGSGKELVARAVHDNSSRSEKIFMAINCGALVESLLESELFGHEKGSFTGAVGRREGIFKRADKGTVFLDEVGETTPGLQVKLLRVLEEGSFTRVGGTEPVYADVRIVAATNRELTDAIGERKFRDDLYFRLGAVRINMAPLTERKADIIPLVDHFFTLQTGQRRGMSENVTELLINYGWPGNVRQIHNFVSRVAMASESGEIPEHLVLQFFEEQGYAERTLPVVTDKTPRQAEFELIYQALLSLGQEVRMLRDLILDNLPVGDEHDFEQAVKAKASGARLEEIEEELITKTLNEVGGNRREAARRLGIGERTLYRKLKKYRGDI